MPPKGVENLRKAKCNECPLKAELVKCGDWKPVPAELNESSTVFVTDSPDKTSVDLGFPFVGEFGYEVLKTVEAEGKKREQVSWTHVVACRYPNDKPKEFLGRLKSKNRRRKRQREAPIPTPAECCKPRFEADMEDHENVVTFGPEALRAVGVDPRLRVNTPTLKDFRGFPTTTYSGQRLLATNNNVLYERKWLWVMRLDLAKAFRHFAGKTTWTPPTRIYKPTAAQLRAFFQKCADAQKPFVFDVETSPHAYVLDENGKDMKPVYDAQKDPLRCIGFGTDKVGLVVPCRSVDGTFSYKRRDGRVMFVGYTPDEQVEIDNAIREGLIRTDVVKVGHNCESYDRQVIEHHYGIIPTRVLDTLPVHKLGMSEYPKGLSFLASIYTDSPPWKAEHTASEAVSDEELYEYNCNDLKNNYLVAKPVQEKARNVEQLQLYPTYRKLIDIGVGMHRLGLPVNEKKRLAHKDRLEGELLKWGAVLREGAEDSEFNPNSPAQWQELLFEKWDLPVQGFTDGGDPSTNDEALRGLLSNPLVEPWQKDIIKAGRKYRGADKLLGTYIDKWYPGGAFVSKDGFLCPDYNASGTVGWRYSSSGPNVQNIPYELRDVFEALEGMLWINCDMDALELKLASALAEADYYIDAFEKNTIDPHNLSGQMVFGPAYWEIEGAPTDIRKKGDGPFKARRDLIKRFVYAALYGAHSPTIHSLLTEAEADKDTTRADGRVIKKGDLLYDDLTLQEVRRIHRRWLKAAPEFKQWWDKSVNEYRQQGYLADPVWGLRRYFANGENMNEIVNFKVQAGGGAIVHQGMFALVYGEKGQRPLLPFDFKRRTGLAIQVHDSLGFLETEKRIKEEGLVEAVSAGMTRKALGRMFTAEAKAGKSLAKV